MQCGLNFNVAVHAPRNCTREGRGHAGGIELVHARLNVRATGAADLDQARHHGVGGSVNDAGFSGRLGFVARHESATLAAAINSRAGTAQYRDCGRLICRAPNLQSPRPKGCGSPSACRGRAFQDVVRLSSRVVVEYDAPAHHDREMTYGLPRRLGCCWLCGSTRAAGYGAPAHHERGGGGAVLRRGSLGRVGCWGLCGSTRPADETLGRLTTNGGRRHGCAEDRLGRLGGRGLWFPSTSSGQALRDAGRHTTNGG